MGLVEVPKPRRSMMGLRMPVTVDRRSLSPEDLGLKTVGELLAHVQKENRLVVRMLIDGQEPDRKRIGSIRKSQIDGRTIFIETADPQKLAGDCLSEVSTQLEQAERMQSDAAKLLEKNSCALAMEKLAGCFSTWQHAEESVLKIAQLLRLDLGKVSVGETTLRELFSGFTRHLRKIRTALDTRDFKKLAHILTAETQECGQQWRLAIETMRSTIASL
jgi:hypothetical protein